MAPAVSTIAIAIPDDLSEQLTQLGDRLPELLRQCVQPAILPAHVYRYILPISLSAITYLPRQHLTISVPKSTRILQRQLINPLQ